MTTEGFDHDSFWKKARRWARKVPFVKDTVAMYFTMVDSKTPLAAKATIAAALGYFVLPFDLFPDMLGPLGFVDDGAAIATALTVVQAHVTREHYEQAEVWLAPR